MAAALLLNKSGRKRSGQKAGHVRAIFVFKSSALQIPINQATLRTCKCRATVMKPNCGEICGNVEGEKKERGIEPLLSHRISRWPLTWQNDIHRAGVLFEKPRINSQSDGCRAHVATT